MAQAPKRYVRLADVKIKIRSHMETENNYTIHSHIHQYAPKVTVGHRRSLVAKNFTRMRTFSFHKRDSEVIFTAIEEYTDPYCHGRLKKKPVLTSYRLYVLRIGLSPTPTLCTFSARLLSSSQSLDFLHIDFTTKIKKSQYFFKIRVRKKLKTYALSYD